MRTTASVFIAAAAAMLASAAATGIAAAQHDSPGGPATVKDVMISMTIPASDAIFTMASDPPKDEAQWEALRKASLTLAESGTLLMSPRLARDNATWMEMARDFVVKAEATLKLAETKDSAALEDAGDSVYGTCEACHGRYMEPGN